MSTKRRSFLSPWRAQGTSTEVTSHDAFDEIVVSDWLHAEVMSARHVWIRLGPLNINVTDGKVRKIRIDRDAEDGKPCEVIVDGEIAGRER
jgi:hypothetical protein